jgi:hypothetical protein
MPIGKRPIPRLKCEDECVGEAVRLTVVPDEGAAEALCGLLRSEGIDCFYRDTDVSAAGIFWGHELRRLARDPRRRR